MSERDMRTKVVRMLRSKHGIAVENPALPGTPDVAYINGWIECKWLRGWPKRADTIVTVDHFTQQQRVFLRRWCVLGGSAWLLLQVRREWLLFTGTVAAHVLGSSTREQLIAEADRYWQNGLPHKEFVSWLCEHQT